MIFTYPATLRGIAYALVKDQTMFSTFFMLMFILIALTTSSTKYCCSPFTSFLHLSSTHLCICFSIRSFIHGASTHRAAMKIFRSPSPMDALYNVDIIPSFSCLPSTAICFSYSYLRPLNSITLLVDTPFSLGASTHFIIASFMVHPLPCEPILTSN